MKEVIVTSEGRRYIRRVERLATFMAKAGVDAAVFIDEEADRCRDVRYLCGQPSDAILIVYSDAHTILLPWDVNMAHERAYASKIVPYTDYQCKKVDAIKAMMADMKGARIEVPPTVSHIDYALYCEALAGCSVVAREDGVHAFVAQMRMIKDEYETECTRRACRVGDAIIDQIEAEINTHKISTEADVALLIERELRIAGCERTGFDTLAAGASRSWAIHAFPGYTAGAWPDRGLNILDFGVVFEGYTSDTTLTVAKGTLTEKQEEMLSLVHKAADECAVLYREGVAIKDAAKKASDIFASHQMNMPHSLGHAIGLDIHEVPRVSINTAVKETGDVSDGMFHAGMILTLEPGLYEEEAGGVRLENDILVTDGAPITLTDSRIIRLK